MMEVKPGDIVQTINLLSQNRRIVGDFYSKLEGIGYQLQRIIERLQCLKKDLNE